MARKLGAAIQQLSSYVGTTVSEPQWQISESAGGDQYGDAWCRGALIS